MFRYALASLFIAGLLGLSGAAAQPASGDRVEACEPVDCDPKKANGDRVSDSGPVRVILYGHFRDLLQLAPMDTRGPADDMDVNLGFSMPTVNTETGTPADVHFRNNRFQMVSTALPGPFGLPGEGLAQPAALPFNVTLAGDEAVSFWYVSPNVLPAPTPAGDPPSAGAVAAAGVHVRMETGHFSGRGQLIAEGDTGLGHGVADASRVSESATLIRLPDGDWVYEFRVPLRIVQAEIPAGEAVLVTATVYQASTSAGDATQGGWRLRTGPAFPPRVIVDVVNPMQTTSGTIQREGRDLVVRWSLAGAWGAFDVDFSSISLRVDGPRPLSEEEFPLVKLQFDSSRASHMGPVQAVWSYPYKREGMPDGTYTVNATALNQQGTYRLVWTESLDVAGGEPKVKSFGSAPGLGVFAFLAAAGVAAMAVRSRPRW